MFPKRASRFERVDAGFLPPGCFIAHAVHQPMVDSAERDSELVARLAAERAGLGEAEMMGIRRLAAANQAGPLGDITQVRLIAKASRLGDRQDALVDAAGPIAFGSIRFRGWRHGGWVDCGYGGDRRLLGYEGFLRHDRFHKPRYPLLERILDELGIGSDEAVLGGQHPARPGRRFVGLGDARDLAQQLVP
jgi:hypothetical protein